jgi:hypothetical protein
MRRVDGLCCLLLLVSGAVSALGQQGTSTLIGVVADPADAVVPNAMLVLTENATGTVRNLVTPVIGLFRFVDLPPGRYSLRVKTPGFKVLDLTDIDLISSETRNVGKLVVQVGGSTEQITVTASTTPVQTASSERSASVLQEQLQDLGLKGRDPFGMVQLIPGVVDSNVGNRDLESAYSMGGISINGMSPQALNVAIDGITEMDEG